MKKFKKDVIDFFLEEILFTFIMVSIIVAIVVYAPWAIYKIAAGLSGFLLKNAEIPISLYGIGIYSAFAFPKMVKLRKTQIRVNTIITILVSIILLFICVEFWWMIPLLGILISTTCIKNKYTGVEYAEKANIICPNEEKE